MKTKMKTISVRLDRDNAAMVARIAKLSGQPADVVVSVLLALGMIKVQLAQLAGKKKPRTRRG